MNSIRYLDSEVKMPLLPLPVRTTVVTVGAKTLLISPGSRLTPEQLKSAGDVTDIVLPSHYHTAGCADAVAVFPNAKVWTPGDLNENTWPYKDELPMIQIGGMPKIKESVFIHKPSRSLIVADLCFNLINARGFGAWLILNMFGTYKKFGVSRFFLKSVEDKAALEKSLSKIFAHEFDRIVVGHGEMIERDGKNQLLRAFAERGFHPA